jgi:hypothetical protein
VSNITGDSAADPMPMYLSVGVARTLTPSMAQSPAHSPIVRNFGLRYIRPTGTLVALWQRQNDVNYALAAQRRTTAASPTLAADSATSRSSLSRLVPLRGYTARAHKLRGCCSSQTPICSRNEAPAA